MHDYYYDSFNAVTVTWRGNNITGIPTLIYHDEVETVVYSTPPTLSNSNGPGGLLCNSTVGPIAWWPGNGLINSPGPFDTNRRDRLIYQIIPDGNLAAQIVNDGRRYVDVSGSNFHNGLFTCRRNGDISTAVPVGFYQRNGRTGELICVHNKTQYTTYSGTPTCGFPEMQKPL